MANIARDIFKAYDIRGIVGKTLTDEAAYLIGKAIATKASEKGITRIALGRDGRLSGPGLMAQIQRGFTDSGIDVLNVGMVATPMLYFAAINECGDDYRQPQSARLQRFQNDARRRHARRRSHSRTFSYC